MKMREVQPKNICLSAPNFNIEEAPLIILEFIDLAVKPEHFLFEWGDLLQSVAPRRAKLVFRPFLPRSLGQEFVCTFYHSP